MSQPSPRDDRRVPSNWTMIRILTIENLVAIGSAVLGGVIVWTNLVAEVNAMKVEIKRQELKLAQVEATLPPLNSNLAVLNSKMDNIDENVRWLRMQVTVKNGDK